MNHDGMLTIDVTPTEPKNITPMTEDEARESIKRVNQGIASIRLELLELHRRQGWKALGYSSLKEFAAGELNFHRDTLYKMIEGAEVEVNLVNAGVEPSIMIDTPLRQLRAIAKAPVTKQVEAFRLLKIWEKNGKVTEREAEAAVAAVYPNFEYRKIEALCLPLIKDGIEIPEHDAAETVFKYWKDKGKPVSKVLSEVLRGGIEEFFEDIPQSEKTASCTPSANNSTDPELNEALEIVSFLKEFQPKTVARAFKLMAKEYQVITTLRLVSHLDKETVSTVLKDEEIEIDDIKKLADDCESLCLHLDQVF